MKTIQILGWLFVATFLYKCKCSPPDDFYIPEECKRYLLYQVGDTVLEIYKGDTTRYVATSFQSRMRDGARGGFGGGCLSERYELAWIEFTSSNPTQNRPCIEENGSFGFLEGSSKCNNLITLISCPSININTKYLPRPISLSTTGRFVNSISIGQSTINNIDYSDVYKVEIYDNSSDSTHLYFNFSQGLIAHILDANNNLTDTVYYIKKSKR
jgi:hypothetical protein